MGKAQGIFTCGAHNLQLPLRTTCPKCTSEARARLHTQRVAFSEAQESTYLRPAQPTQTATEELVWLRHHKRWAAGHRILPNDSSALYLSRESQEALGFRRGPDIIISPENWQPLVPHQTYSILIALYDAPVGSGLRYDSSLRCALFPFPTAAIATLMRRRQMLPSEQPHRFFQEDAPHWSLRAQGTMLNSKGALQLTKAFYDLLGFSPDAVFQASATSHSHYRLDTP